MYELVTAFLPSVRGHHIFNNATTFGVLSSEHANTQRRLPSSSDEIEEIIIIIITMLMKEEETLGE